MSKKAEIFIYDTIGGDWYYGYGCTAKGILQDLKKFNDDKDVKEITVRINSPGGSIFEGVAIYNLLQQNSKPVNTIIDGIAYSMAAIVAMAGKHRSMAKNATMLIHCCNGMGWGNARDLKATVEMMEKIDSGLSESIAESSGKTLAQVKDKWMNYDDHTLTAREALDEKLIDEVMDFKGDVPADLKNMTSDQLFAFYAKKNGRGEQESFFNKVVTEIKSFIKPDKQAPTPTTDNNMDFKKTLKALTDGATAEERTAAIAEVNAFTGANEKFTQAEVDAIVAAAEKAATDASAKTVKDAQDALKVAQDEVTALKGPDDKTKKPVKDAAEEAADRADKSKVDFADANIDYNARANKALGIS